MGGKRTGQWNDLLLYAMSAAKVGDMTGKILLVEDNPDDEFLALRVVKNHFGNGAIVVVRDGAEAIAYLSGTANQAFCPMTPTPDLILLDLKLPKVNGLEVLLHIGSDEKLRDIPVAILTSSDNPDDMRLSMEYGARFYLSKPLDSRQFRKVLQELRFETATAPPLLPGVPETP